MKSNRISCRMRPLSRPYADYPKYVRYVSYREFSSKLTGSASDSSSPNDRSSLADAAFTSPGCGLPTKASLNNVPASASISKNDIRHWDSVNTDWRSVPSMYLKLSKIRLTTLVATTTVAGYAAATSPFCLDSFLCCCLGTGLVSSAANAINQYHEVPFDAQMSRTKNRVLVKAQLSPLHALGFAGIASTLGFAVMYCGCNGLTASLGALNLVLYTCVYTPLKRISILNTWVGSVVGALPPMMGWVSCTGHLDAGAWLLGAILYAWQFPHFNALSWNLRPDYSKAGYRMMAVTHPDLCRRTALRYTIFIGVLCFLAPLCDVTNNYFPFATLPLNIYFVHLAYRFYRKADSGNSRKLFKFSLIHLPLLITLMLVNKKRWFVRNDLESNDSVEKNFQVPTLNDSSRSNSESTASC